MVKEYTYSRISDDDYRKAVGTLRLRLNDVFQAFNIYGLHIFINGAIDEVVELAEQFGQRVRGKSIPIQLKRKRNARRS